MSTVSNVSFQSRLFVSGTIKALTGLHIGGNSTEMSIGGADKIVVRDPVSNWPYIPGSSLRGKMRSLLERSRGEMTIRFEDSRTPDAHNMDELEKRLGNGARIKAALPATDPRAAAARFFGIAIDQQQGARPENIVPQRLVVRDARLANPELLENMRSTDMPLTEVKTEVAIDRITSQANPRQIERVPAGAAFDFEFVISLYGEDDETEFIGLLFECMQLLQDDYLGGNGSRGYGRVKFDVQEVKRKTAADYRENRLAESVDFEVPPTLKA